MKIDCHVHIVGNGSAGSGCRIFVRKVQHKMLVRVMLGSLGLPPDLLDGDLDRVYAGLLLRWVRESSLDRIVILAMDYVHDKDGTRREDLGSFYVPNDYVLQLACENPAEFIPSVSIHPARADALDELDKCIAGGARVMKILPNCHNINCSDRRYEKFWRKMADARMPLLAHTGGELSLPVINKAYADPAVLTLPLECGVTVIAAHCATSSHPFDADYSRKFLGMLKKFPNLYGDSSALNTPFRSKHYRRLFNSGLAERIIHGSDIPIPVSPFWVYGRKLIDRRKYSEIKKIKNLLELDYQIKLALGFPERSFEALGKLLFPSG